MKPSTFRHMSRTAALAVLWAVTATPTASALEPGPAAATVAESGANGSLTPGQRVRVTASSAAYTGVSTGTVVKVGADTLTLIDPKSGAVIELTLSSITRVEVSRQSRGTKKGFLIGLGLGALGAVGIFLPTENDEICSDSFASGSSTVRVSRECTGGEKAALGASMLLTGGGVGAWLGHRRVTDRWSDVPRRPSEQSSSDLTWQVSPILDRAVHGGGLKIRLSW